MKSEPVSLSDDRERNKIAPFRKKQSAESSGL